MAQRRLLSGSSGTFWGLVGEGEWTRLLLSDASVVRLTDRASSPNTVISSFSDDGDVNTVVVEDVNSRLNSGTPTAVASYFGFPITKPDGSPLDLGADCFTIDLSLEVTATPGITDDNNVILAIGINDGTSSMENGRFGGFIEFDTSTGGKVGNFSGGGGMNEGGADADILVLRSTLTTTPTGSELNPFYSITSTAYDVNGDFQRDKYSAGINLYQNSPSARPIGTGSYAFIAVGRKGTAGSGAKTFKFRTFYKVSMLTFNDTPQSIPGR